MVSFLAVIAYESGGVADVGAAIPSHVLRVWLRVWFAYAPVFSVAGSVRELGLAIPAGSDCVHLRVGFESAAAGEATPAVAARQRRCFVSGFDVLLQLCLAVEPQRTTLA